MFIKDNLRFNIHQRYTDPATGEHGIDMTSPANRERFGVTEIPDPVRMPDETHYNQEINEPPYLICAPKSPEQLAQQAQAKINAESLAYLASTDWMVFRSIDEPGRPMPADVRAARKAARDAIVPQLKP